MSAKNKLNWTSPADLRALIQKRWQSGKLLKDWLGNELTLPYPVPLSKPNRQQLNNAFGDVRQWISGLHQASMSAQSPAKQRCTYTIVWQTSNLRHLGNQKLPQSVCFTSFDELFGFIGKQANFASFQSITNSLLEHWPDRVDALKLSLKKAPFRALALADQWHQVVAVLQHLQTYPKPGLYIRQLSLPGVDTKFIENNRPLLNDLLTAILPPIKFDASVEALRQHGFERKFGLLYEQPLIRFRLLDPNETIQGLSDISLPTDQFHALNLQPERVFITENKINGLTFPEVSKAMVIFGLGYGVSALMGVPWLARPQIFYWGDIDTHGFKILDFLRLRFPNAQSLMMDEKTLLACQPLWVEEPEPTQATLNRLTNDEQALYQSLQNHRWGNKVRLEQERIPYSMLLQSLECLL